MAKKTSNIVEKKVLSKPTKKETKTTKPKIVIDEKAVKATKKEDLTIKSAAKPVLNKEKLTTADKSKSILSKVKATPKPNSKSTSKPTKDIKGKTSPIKPAIKAVKIPKEKKITAKPIVEKSETLPDFIKHVLISQPEPTGEKSPYVELSKKYNLKIDFKPFLKVENIPLREFRKSKITIGDYTAVIFNSKNAIDYFFKICDEMRYRMPQEAKYFCSSETIAFYLQKYIQYRKRKVTYANGTLQDFQTLLTKHKTTERFILPCSSLGVGQLPIYLKNNKFDYVECVMYRMISNDSIKESDLTHQMITFFNPEGVKSFFTLFPNFKQKKVAIGAFGDSTIKALESYGMEIHAKAPVGEIKSMVMAIDKLFKEFPKMKK